jgi:hypothetical protein
MNWTTRRYEGLVAQEGFNCYVPTVEQVREIAEAILSEYPQYADFWNDHALVRINRNIKTKMGQAFLKDDITIGKLETLENHPVLGNVTRATVFSFRNTCNTIISPAYVEFL